MIDPAQHVEAPPADGMASKSLAFNAEESLIVEHNLSPWEAIKAYPMAIFWCVVISACVIMEGYDQILVQSFYAYPQFQLKYGEYVGVGSTGYQINAPWQAGLSNASGVGAFFGTLMNGVFGHKRVLLGALVTLSAFIFITFFAPNLPVLCVGQILSGLPWGIFATAAPAYASECLPMVLRVYFTSFTNMCFIIGQLISAGVLRGLQGRQDEWAYRIPFALQWMWPIFLIPLVSMAPASPWHEVRKGRLESAEKSLRRLQRKSADIDPKKTLAMIVYTNNLEEQLQVGTTYWDCLKGFELRRTEIACMCFIGQPLSGGNFAYNSSYFFERVGLNTETTYSLNLGGTGLALLGTLINWFYIMPRFGRRPTYLLGMAVMIMALMAIGILQVWGDRPSVGYAQSALCLFWTFAFQLSVGQLGWALPAEVGSTRLRQKTICLARNAYYIVNVVSGVLQSYFINPTAWNLSGYTGFFWGGTSIVVLVWAFFRLPETKDRSYEQLDVLFAQKVPARHFKKTDPDVFNHYEVN
ncbi:general substrate transporter [Ilyonectria robusta]|uniref:general substrate transporter n=1 Tax=Ilyonectria robusta TaxID=1079257 RepID=UPI001E8CC862|nr:general substrate transporter [Ilyonectria robusta]KAH8654877.1 general substrate transporter [Ilyonectria robusta]